MIVFDLLRFALVMIVFALSEGAVGTVYQIESASMQPNFRQGDSITVIPLDEQPLQRGELIVFQNPRFRAETHLKRIIGLPGETVVMAGAAIWIDGGRLDESYAIVPAPAGQTYDITLQAGEYFVLGDDRPNSHDSRRMGPIQADLIVGRVKITAWNLLLNGELQPTE